LDCKERYYIRVLGTAQDGGYPHLGCKGQCCKLAWKNINLHRLPSSIALVDKLENKFWLFDATPKIREQLHVMSNIKLSGIFLTHAHYGHYIGLLELGKEVLNANNVPVYAMPKMFNFIVKNSPFDLLIKNKNILLKKIVKNKIILDNEKSVECFEVKHRSELSETVGYRIKANDKSIIYLPDLDHYREFVNEIKNIIKDNNLIFLDGTFYDKKEIKNRDINDIPHPEILESMSVFSKLNDSEKKKIHFIHFNHTNPTIDIESIEAKKVIQNGFLLSKDNQIFNL